MSIPELNNLPVRAVEVHLLQGRESLRWLHEDPDLALDFRFGQLHVTFQFVLIDPADDEQVDDSTVLALGVVVQDVDRLHPAQILLDLVHDLIYP